MIYTRFERRHRPGKDCCSLLAHTQNNGVRARKTRGLDRVRNAMGVGFVIADKYVFTSYMRVH